MRHLHAFAGAACLLLACGPALYAADSPLSTVATFESMSVYLDGVAGGAHCKVRYRVAGAGDWREGYPLVYDARDRQCRGSLVQLAPDTAYDVEVTDGARKVAGQGRTRAEKFAVGKTTQLPAGITDKTITIKEAGRPDAWHLVTPAPGTRFVSDVFNQSDYNIVIEAEYVILRGADLRNAGVHGVLIRRGVQNVVVEDCHITGWGRVGGARVWGITFGSDSAVYAERGAGNLVIQRNLIEYPRSGSNDWESGHPDGPQGISLIDSSGGNVIRYNSIRSTDDHGYNDGIGGASNFSLQGSPNRDSDIYGNIISHCWDDAIESEGANRNVRIWSNYIHHTFVHIATAATGLGPVYIFRNVFGESRVSHVDHSGGMMLKTGGRTIDVNGQPFDLNLGYRFVFHNTALQPNGGLSVFSGHELHNAVSRNNIFYAKGSTYPSVKTGPPNDFKNDLTGGYIGGGQIATMFLQSNALQWYLAPTMKQVQWGKVDFERNGKKFGITDPVVDAPNPALDKGVRIPGFNDDFAGAAPDIGAFENGRPPLRFGREMAPDFQRAAWELP